jgi:3beta-hydroxy-delta5-steroid dehydrogenase/steroid delta-isomerase
MTALLHGLSADGVGPRVLVTGGAGYLGRHLVDALLQLGCTVRTLDVVAGPTPDSVDARIGDIRDPSALHDALANIDTVFHAAAVIELSGIAPDAVRERAFGVNLTGTHNDIDGCLAQGVRRLVHTSTANVCIEGPLEDADETAPYVQGFIDLYAETKVPAERAVLGANSEELRTIALRPGGLWGPGEGGFMIATFLQALAQDRLVATIGDGTAVADNTHVLSLVRAELLAAQTLRLRPEVVGGRPYFVTDEERFNAMTWFRPIAEGLGYRWPTLHLPGWLMYAIAWASEVFYRLGGPAPGLTRIGVIKVIQTSSFVCDRARKDLGYRPLHTRESGIAAHLDDYRSVLERLKAAP